MLGTCSDLNLGKPLRNCLDGGFRYFLFSCPKDIQVEGLILDGGLRYVLFSSLVGEMIQF